MAVTSNSIGKNDALTMDKLKAMMDIVRNLPPPPQFYSGRRYPADRAIKFKRENGEEVCLAHPAFWLRIPRSEPTMTNNFWGIPIIDLDDAARRDIAETIDVELAEAILAASPPPPAA